MPGPTIEFWFSIGSTYTYLTAMRLEEVARSSGVEVHWRPFSVRAIMIEQKNIPFMGKPVKMAYMWRDISATPRRTAFPPAFPRPIRSPNSIGRTGSPWLPPRGGMVPVLCAQILSPLVPGGRGARPRAKPQKRSGRNRAGSGASAGESLERSGRAGLPGGDRRGEATERLRLAELSPFPAKSSGATTALTTQSGGRKVSVRRSSRPKGFKHRLRNLRQTCDECLQKIRNVGRMNAMLTPDCNPPSFEWAAARDF